MNKSKIDNIFKPKSAEEIFILNEIQLDPTLEFFIHTKYTTDKEKDFDKWVFQFKIKVNSWALIFLKLHKMRKNVKRYPKTKI